MHIFKTFLKSVLFLFLIAIVTIGLAIISIIRNPINRHVRKLDKDFGQMYSRIRSKEEIILIKQQMDTLSKTGSGINGNFSRTQAERDEEIEKEKDNKDLYNAIKQAKDKGLTIDLSGADLFFAQLQNIDLSGANLSQTICIGTNLEGANLSGANLTGALLSGTKLQNAKLKNANLMGAELDRTQLVGADLSEAILHEALLVWTNLSEANMSNVDLTNSVMIQVTTGNTKFVGADFRDARIYSTFAKSVDLTGAKFDTWIIRAFNTFTIRLLTLWESINIAIERKGQRQA